MIADRGPFRPCGPRRSRGACPSRRPIRHICSSHPCRRPARDMNRDASAPNDHPVQGRGLAGSDHRDDLGGRPAHQRVSSSRSLGANLPPIPSDLGALQSLSCIGMQPDAHACNDIKAALPGATRVRFVIKTGQCFRETARVSSTAVWSGGLIELHSFACPCICLQAWASMGTISDGVSSMMKMSRFT